MKKAAVFIFLVFISTGVLTACSPVSHMNILSFTDSYNNRYGKNSISLSDYIVTENSYKLLFEKEGFPVLFTAEVNNKNQIKKIRLTISKVDEKGKLIAPDGLQANFFKETAVRVLSAYMLEKHEDSVKTAEKILPLKSEDLLKTGELTMEKDNYHFVYYSNKICCQFTVTNTFLEKTQVTHKPESKPLYEATANISGGN